MVSLTIENRNHYPAELLEALSVTAQELGETLYVVGGPVRDWLLGLEWSDLDLTLSSDAEYFCKKVIGFLGTGTLVPLTGRENKEDGARIVYHRFEIDITGFRGIADTIETDLLSRDFTMNSIAVSFADFLQNRMERIIDPQNGVQDISNRRIHVCKNSFTDDPLRMLRAYRFRAVYGFSFSGETEEELAENIYRISRTAPERILHELALIMASDKAGETFIAMNKSGLLLEIFPELRAGKGMEQPDFHHLDVLDHSLEALLQVEKIVLQPVAFFPSAGAEKIESVREKSLIKWAALFHDVGKPFTMSPPGNDGQRTTFYNHDRAGSEMFKKLGKRLRFSKDEIAAISRLIDLHMYPFHLCNQLRTGELSRKAMTKMARKAGDILQPLFCLAMADSLASRGEMKPDNMEEELSSLYAEVEAAYEKDVLPVISAPRLLTGNDLIDIFGLSPGPVFKEILSDLELAVIELGIKSRKDAIKWVKKYLSGLAET